MPTNCSKRMIVSEVYFDNERRMLTTRVEFDFNMLVSLVPTVIDDEPMFKCTYYDVHAGCEKIIDIKTNFDVQ